MEHYFGQRFLRNCWVELVYVELEVFVVKTVSLGLKWRFCFECSMRRWFFLKKWFWGLQVLEGLDAVLDVGGVYDPTRDRYDHHQKGFEEVFGLGFSTKLSSAGLVYKVISVFKSTYGWFTCGKWIHLTQPGLVLFD